MQNVLKRLFKISLTIYFSAGILGAYCESLVKNNQEDITSHLSINNNEYILGPGDIIQLKIYGLENHTQEIPILSDGTCIIPLLGTTYIENLTIEEAKLKIKKLLTKELISPEIELSIISQRPVRVIVIGEVNRPGFYNLTKLQNPSSKLSTFQSFTLIDAIKEANGITPYSNLLNINLKRKISNSDRFKQINLNLLSVLQDGDQLNNPYLLDGDVIRISKTNNNNSQQFDILSTNLTSDKININIVGEVLKPGQYELASSTPFNQAILAAGGPLKSFSNKSKIKLIRIKDSGSVEVTKHDFSYKTSLNNPKLQNGDTIFIGENLYGKSLRNLKNFNEPFLGLYSLIRTIDLLSD